MHKLERKCNSEKGKTRQNETTLV